MSSIRINDFDISTNIQHKISLSRGDANVRIRLQMKVNFDPPILFLFDVPADLRA